MNMEGKRECHYVSCLQCQDFIRAVDRADQILTPDDATRKTKMWNKKLSLHLRQVAFLNDYLVYTKILGSKPMDFYSFQCNMICDLLFMEHPAPDPLQFCNKNLVRLRERASLFGAHSPKTGVYFLVCVYCFTCLDLPGLQ